MRMAVIVGVRPQFVKLAPLLGQLRQRHVVTVISTGQHYDPALSGDLVKDLHTDPPDVLLTTRRGSRIARLSGSLEAVEAEIIRTGDPDAIVVIGDSDPAYAGASVANVLGLPLVHIEAGLRSGDLEQPEERNRIVIDAASSLCFAPTANCLQNLRLEGKDNVILSGDLHLDAVLRTLQQTEDQLVDGCRDEDPDGEFVLVTTHRSSMVHDDRSLEAIASTLAALGMNVVWALHPGAKAKLESKGLIKQLAVNRRFTVLDPQPHSRFLSLLKAATLVMTDSGGVQREAYFLGVRCLVLRRHTEFPETLVGGLGMLQDPNSGDLHSAARSLLGGGTPDVPDLMAFGNGEASIRICEGLDKMESSR